MIKVMNDVVCDDYLLWEQGAVGSNPIPTLIEPVGNDGFFVYTRQ